MKLNAIHNSKKYQKNGFKKNKFKVKCYKCGKTNHYKNECKLEKQVNNINKIEKSKQFNATLKGITYYEKFNKILNVKKCIYCK